MTEQFPFNDDDVISMAPDITGNTGQILRIQNFRQAMRKNLNNYAHQWLDQGIECEILSTDGGGWQKGRVYLRLEFIPNTPPPSPGTSDAVRSPSEQ